MNYKKAIIAGLVGSIGVAVLGLSFSFAWYGTSENLYIDTLNIRVSGTQELKISTSSELSTFKESVKYKLGEEDNDLMDVGQVRPVSSMFKSNWLEDDLKTEPEFYVYDTPGHQIGEDVPPYQVANWGFYSQHLYLYSSSTIYSTIDSETFQLTELEAANEEYATILMGYKGYMDEYAVLHPDWTREEIHADLVEKLNRLKYCMRISIYDISENKYYIIDPYKGTTDVLLGGRLDVLRSGYYDSYRDQTTNEMKEIIYGELEHREKAFYLEALDEDGPEPAEYNSFSSRTKAGVRAFDLDKSLEDGLDIKKEDSLNLGQVEDKVLLSLIAGIPKEIVFSIYMEGWDLDCTNVHMGGSFSLGLEFKISEQIQ